jgi:hypothetical protein
MNPCHTRAFTALKLLLSTSSLLMTPGVVADLYAQLPCNEKVIPQIRIDPGHPWRPPFGLERIGKPLTAVVELTADARPVREYYLAAVLHGRELERHALNLGSGKTFFSDTVMLDSYPDELVLSAKCRFEGQETELLRYTVKLPVIEADATARPEKQINPVDLGTIFVPNDWLLLAAGQKAIVNLAAISHGRAISDVRVKAWFESSKKTVETSISLADGKRTVGELQVGPMLSGPAKDNLHVSLTAADGSELWHKEIRTMFVAERPELPNFGAVEIKLRYDAPISVRDAKSGRMSSIDYDTAWKQDLQDVVVALPNGSRFVFWRGSSYIPFWAGAHNTGFSYEWAETTPPPDGFVDSVEPLMDKELRYGRVEILESTPSRVRVRWTYQSTDFLYKVWGDEAQEDFCFYPDGFGTRTLTLKSAPGADYELSEFIILTAQSAYPFEVLPKDIVDKVYLDGSKEAISFPYHSKSPGAENFLDNKIPNTRKLQIIYRIHIHKDDGSTPIYFYPKDTTMPLAFGPFYDRGYLVTPAYWGSHWPLGRGNSTGRTIDDRIYSNPGHNSLVTWGMSNRPAPTSTTTVETIDTLGKAKTMTVQQWSWLIGKTNVSDQRLIEWAQSFSSPPEIALQGANLDFDSYSRERRAIRIRVTQQTATVTLKPVSRCVNPVLELTKIPAKLFTISLNDKAVPQSDYAWDGHTLWLNVTLDKPATLTLRFR